MAKKPLSDKVCQRRLTKWMEENYSEEVMEVLEFYNDVADEGYYRFVFDNPVTGRKKVTIAISRGTGNITQWV